MPLETNLNQSPYFDDFNENKNFHRVLFRPGFAVQARELTQLQTILQNQIERFADEVIVDGTVITGCGLNIDNKLNFVKLRDKDANTRSIILSDFTTSGVVANATVTGSTTGVTADLIAVVDGSETADPNFFTVFVSYTNSGTSGTSKTFADNETLIFRNKSDNSFRVAANTIGGSFGNSTGYGTLATVQDGIIYHKGNFVRVDNQNHVVSKYSTTPTVKVGFITAESIVDSNQDSSLLDNASGSTNFAAPGADRLKLTPTLTSRSITQANTQTFFSIGNIENGFLVRTSTSTEYDDIADFMKQKFYETNGNYATRPFFVRMREHLKTSTNLGRYNADGGGSSDKLVAEIEEGIGYVSGTRTEIGETISRDVDKGTDTETLAARTFSISYGNYVRANQVVGAWDFKNLNQVSLKDAAQNAMQDGNYDSASEAGSTIGTANIRSVEYHSGSSGHADGQFRIYLYNIKMNSGKTFDQVEGIYYSDTESGLKGFANVLTIDGKKLQEPSIAKLVFPFARRGTKKNGVSAQSFVTKKIQGVTFNNDNSRQATLTISGVATGGTETFNDSVTSEADRRNFIIVAKEDVETVTLNGTAGTSGSSNTVTGSSSTFVTHFEAGDLIRIGTSTTRIVSVNSDTQLTVDPAINESTSTYTKVYPAGYIFDFGPDGSGSDDSSTQRTINIGGANVASSWTADVYYDALRSSAVGIAKVVNKNKYVELDLSSHTSGISGPWPLGVPDGLRLRKVYKGTAGSVTTTDTDVTDEFSLDNGQRETMYDLANLVLKPKSTLSLTTGDGLLVEFDYFTIDRSAGTGFFNINSYPIDDSDPDGASNIAIQDIPIFVVPSTGAEIDLRDAVDFRQVKSATATPNAVAGSAPTNPTASTTFNINADGAYIPASDDNYIATIEAYLSRVDRVVLTSAGNIEIVKGIPSQDPKPKPVPANSMAIATIVIPPFPSLSPHVAKRDDRRDYEVRMTVENNRRYTMKDLRSIDDRVKRVEYYSSLNALEKAANDAQILTDGGLSRFKNGFLVDNFNGFNIADTRKLGFSAAIDVKKSLLRPQFNRSDLSLRKSTNVNFASSNITVKENTAFLDYTHVTYLDQNFASKKRNPCQDLLFSWEGKIKLNPEADNTGDVTTLPDIQVDFDGMLEGLQFLNDAVGTQWGSWEDTGITRDAGSERVELARGRRWARGTVTNFEQAFQTRQGISMDVSPTLEPFDLGSFVRDVSIAEYMRPRNIQFTGFGMRPNTRVFPFFNDELVREYCVPANSSFANTGSLGDALTTDASGTVHGIFALPNNDEIKFRSGTKRFQLIDIANTQTESTLVSTVAHADYSSLPLNITSQGTALNLPQVSFNSETEFEWGARRVASRSNWFLRWDPLAQTFYVDEGADNRNEGIFLTKVDLYFAAKSTNQPFTVEIRTVENGIPTPTILASKTLLPASIVTTSNTTKPTNATTFELDQPIFLPARKEYAIVCKPGGNSPDFILWTAELGGTDVNTEELIHKQAAGGVMLTSSNDKSWTVYQKEDLMFKLHKAQFTSSTGEVYFENEDYDFFTIDNIGGSFTFGEKVRGQSILTFANNDSVSVGQILQTYAAKEGTANAHFANGVIRKVVTSGSGTVTVTVDPYGIFPTTNSSANSLNLFVGTTWVGNTTAFTPNTATGFVNHFDRTRNNLFITSSSGAFAEDSAYVRGQVSGAHAQITSIDDIQLNTLVPKIPEIKFANTSTSWSARVASDSGVISPTFVNLDINKGFDFVDGEKKVFSKSNETSLTAVNGSKKTLILKATVDSTDDTVSPAIDVERSNAYVIGNLINNDATDEQKEAGNALMRYISKPITLKDGQDAEDLTVYVTAFRPSSTDVKVYARIHNPEDEQTLDDKDFTLLTEVSSTDFSDPADEYDYKEIEFGFAANTNGQGFLSTANSHARLNTSNNNVVAYRASDGSIYHTYKSFAIKIVLTASGTEIVPRVRDMRAIALQQ